MIQQIQRHFWQRWSQEYLNTLQQRQKWTSDTEPVKIGSIAIIKDDLTPPLHWRLGRVTELKPGPDGIIRVVILKTVSGFTTRPVTKLCFLPSEPLSN